MISFKEECTIEEAKKFNEFYDKIKNDPNVDHNYSKFKEEIKNRKPAK